jgi:hypothetical protein
VTAGHPNSHQTRQRRALLYICRAQHGEQLQIHRWQVSVTRVISIDSRPQLISLRWLVFDTKAHLTGTTLPYLPPRQRFLWRGCARYGERAVTIVLELLISTQQVM